MLNLLFAATLAAAAPATAQNAAAEPAIGAAPASTTAPQASPAMFVVRDADTTIYLFGTFHALDGRADWFDRDIRDAFDRSGELVLETLVPRRPALTQAPPRPGAGYGNWSVAPSASFLATTRMAICAGRSRGMQVENGADMVLRRAAEAEGKSVAGLETVQSQLNMFNRMADGADAARQPPAAQAAGTAGSRSPMDNLSQAMTDMQAAWRRGDQSVFARMLGQLRASSPDTYRTMFSERNARWADWIAARMQTPGTVFVAVGAGHLAGRDSLLVRLAEKGIESTRVE